MELITFLNFIGTWTLGSHIIIDLIAATTNAFNNTILAGRPDHHRKWTRIGIILIGVIGGVGGGISRDILLNKMPSALVNPWFLLLSLAAASLALAATKRLAGYGIRRTFGYMAAFSLPWYAIIGTQKALEAGLPVIAVILIAVVASTAGRFFVDLISGVTPQQFTRGEGYVATTVVSSLTYIILYALGWTIVSIWPATILAWLVGFSYRMLALRFKWEEQEPWEQDRLHQDSTDSQQ